MIFASSLRLRNCGNYSWHLIHKHFLWVSKCPGKKGNEQGQEETPLIRWDQEGGRWLPPARLVIWSLFIVEGALETRTETYTHTYTHTQMYTYMHMDTYTYFLPTKLYRLQWEVGHYCNPPFPPQDRNSKEMISKKVTFELNLDTKNCPLFILLALPYFSPEELRPSKETCNLFTIFIIYLPHPYVNTDQRWSFTLFFLSLSFTSLLVGKKAKKNKGSHVCWVPLTFQSNVPSILCSESLCDVQRFCDCPHSAEAVTGRRRSGKDGKLHTHGHLPDTHQPYRDVIKSLLVYGKHSKYRNYYFILLVSSAPEKKIESIKLPS